MIELFSMTGGIRTLEHGAAYPFNMINVTWPFANLTATREKLLLHAFSKKYEIEKAKVEKLKKYKGIFSVGLKIDHSEKNIAPSFIFWTFNFEKLKIGLELLGYKVET